MLLRSWDAGHVKNLAVPGDTPHPAVGESTSVTTGSQRRDTGGLPGPVAAVTHGGVTPELLRNLLGDDALPPGVLAAGIQPGAITTVDDLNPVMIASVSHLR
jgi:hypothetical protein